MPFTFFSHQAVVLPLKLRHPERFSGTALVIGSMAPDLEYFLRGKPARLLGHSLAGQFLFCLPLTLVLVWVVTRVIARPLALHLPNLGSFRLREYRHLAHSADRPGYWRLAAFSALIGSFSHIVWDSFTHETGWPAIWLGYADEVLAVGEQSLPAYRALQHGSSIVGAAATLLMLAAIGRRSLLAGWARADEPPGNPAPTRASHLVLWGCTLLGGAAGAGFGLYSHGIPDLRWGPYLLELIGFKTATLAFIGLWLGCVVAPRLMSVETADAAPSAPSALSDLSNVDHTSTA